MNTQERWNYIKNNREIIEQYMALHDEEVRTRRLVKFVGTPNVESVKNIKKTNNVR